MENLTPEVLGLMFTVVVAYGSFAYGKGKRDTKQANTEEDLTSASTKIHNLTARVIELEAEVDRIGNALERSYATTAYCHENFPNREIFDIKLQSVEERLVGEIRGFRNYMSIIVDNNKKG